MDLRCVAEKVMNYLGQRLLQITGIIWHQVHPTFTLSILLCGRYMPLIRLMRAGDIETNPGPNDDSSDRIKYQKMFRDLCRDIAPSSYTDFGTSLEFEYNVLCSVKQKHQMDTKEALMEILWTWKDRQPPGTDTISVLKEKLRESQLDSLVDVVTSHFKPSGSSPSTSLTREQVQQCCKELKEHYRLSRRKIRVDPLNFMEQVDLNKLYTNLSLVGHDDKTQITYDHMLTLEANGSLVKRILIQGEGGVGKTTLCDKIAWDWCSGDKLTELDMVIVIPLRDVSEGQTVSDIAEAYLSQSNTVTSSQIDDYISRNPDKVLLVLDGFDEFSGELSGDSSNEVIRILQSDQFKFCRVFVTSRPWRTSEFTMSNRLAKAYSVINVEGFNKQNLKTYIKRYFEYVQKDALGKDLISFMTENDVIQSHMAPYPIFCAMLCIMWNEADEERRQVMHKLQTFSQFFREMISFLKDHYAAKECENLNDKNLPLLITKADRAILDIGEIALDGLLKMSLSFPEERFNKCTSSMETCRKVGILTLERNVTRIRERRHRGVNFPSFVKSTVSFPHKLFQEYIAGVYIQALFEKDRSKYESLKYKLLPRYEQFRYLLYFSSYATEELGLDIIDGLVQNGDQYFCVDVAFECHAVEAAKRVGKQWQEYALHSSQPSHTLSGMSFMVHFNQVQELKIDKVNCGRTVSRQLAEGMCSSRVLRSVSITASTLHNDFYEILAGEARKCQS
ncbi:NLR family CARD domain-containing protein 4-like [Diadema antillarum]|uniref:NLR family CARD domain-containing protein 4-like n=1 Tax=Diadema antillarum TaxID=105358 RepID=UPI003A8A0D8D